ncbi:MAG: SpoIIE family protein phosphatase [Nitrospinales bacterium]
MTSNPAEIGEVLTGSYHMGLVFFSWAVAVFASYTAMELASHTRESDIKVRKWWVAGCAFAMGGGIWSMHFIAMLAMQLPLQVNYRVLVTLFSLLITVLASGYAFHISARAQCGKQRILIGGTVMGAGISLMHYSGMAAMMLDAEVKYHPGLVALSILVAILASMAALGITNHLCEFCNRKKFNLKLIGAVLMGVAVVGMHYTGMSAATFVYAKNIERLPAIIIDPHVLAFAVGVITFFILVAAIIVSIANRRFTELQKLNEELEQRVQERTREIQGKNKELDEALSQAVEYASLVQKGFLPDEPPELGGYIFAASTVPARIVGGDFYDFIPMGDNKLGLLIGDVSGKGVPAALDMARLVSDFRLISKSESDPAQIMKKVNKALFDRSQKGMFATSIFLMLDTVSKKLWAANAGHHSILIRQNGSGIVEKGHAGGIPLGILPDTNYPPEEISLESGNLVVLYTDGATEPQNESMDPFGKDRLCEIISENDGDPRELITKFQKNIQKFTNNVLPFDDLTFLAFQVL